MTVQADRMWTPQDVSDYLGVPVGTLYRWRTLGIGPAAARIGRHLRYLRSDVDAWIREQQDNAA